MGQLRSGCLLFVCFDVVLCSCCSACLSRQKCIMSDCSLCLFLASSSTSSASLHFSMVAATMVTHMLLLDMVTHTLALDTVIPTLIHLTGTDMDIRTLPICVVIMGIPTAVIFTTNVYKRFVFMLVQCVKCSLTFNIAHHYAVGFVFIISHDSLIIQVPSTSGAFSMHVHSPCMLCASRHW